MPHPDTANGDEAWRPSATRETLELRAALNHLVRAFFHARGVLEVETPVLSQAAVSDPHIAPFQLEFSGRNDGASRTRWLRTSPEYAMKRLLASGVGDCYELGRVFRDGEAGGRHNPEFTLLEWYRVGWDHRKLMDETVELVRSALALVGRDIVHVDVVSYRDLYVRVLGIDPFAASIDELRDALGDILIDPEGLTRDDWLDLLLSHRIQPAFAFDAITVLHDYPATQAALARVRQQADGPALAERFELYLGPLELANGYHELADAAEQASRFAADAARIAAADGQPRPADAHLLAALAHGLPDCAGVALGVDRLLMAMLGTPRIADVLAFDFGRA